MSASRPGNTERGWNDPPMFFYKHENEAQQSPKKTPLTQRVGMPQNYPSLSNKSKDSTGKSKSLLPTASGPPPSGPPPTGPPPSGPPPSGPPPTGPPPSGPPPSGHTPSGPPPSGPPPTSIKPTTFETESATDAIENVPEDLCESTLAKLNLVLQSCQDRLQKRICDDITKKLKILQDAWSMEKLSKPVQQRMSKLAIALTNKDYKEANDIHLSLMVDFVAEVSQWMVGIKRLIYEAKQHLPLLDSEQISEDKQQSEEEIGNEKLTVKENAPEGEHTEITSVDRTEEETSSVKGNEAQTLEGHTATCETTATNCENPSVEEIVQSKDACSNVEDMPDSYAKPSIANAESNKDSKESDRAEINRSGDHIGTGNGKEE